MRYLNTFHTFFSPASGEGRGGATAVLSLRVVRNLLTIIINPEKGQKDEEVLKLPDVLPENSGCFRQSSKKSRL